jgi:putative membrane protein
MILASTILVARMIQWQSEQQQTACLGLVLVGAALSYWLTTLHNANHAEPSLQYLFGCGAIAICAMILPGISGAMVLLILGIYEHLSAIPRALIGGTATTSTFLEIGVFGIGCLLGLVAFSKLLRYLLAVHRPLTMSVLCGVMVGALNKLWPFQDETLVGSGEHQVPHYQNVLPANLGLQTVAVILTALVAVLIILWLDRQFTTESTGVHDRPAQQDADD